MLNYLREGTRQIIANSFFRSLEAMRKKPLVKSASTYI